MVERSSNFMNVYEETIRKTVNSYSKADVYFEPEKIIALPNEISNEIISYLLSCACCAQNELPINIGRKCLSSLPADWITNKLKNLIFKSINIYDEWDYRRFLELSNLISKDLLEWAISISNHSNNSDIIEAAADFTERLIK